MQLLGSQNDMATIRLLPFSAIENLADELDHPESQQDQSPDRFPVHPYSLARPATCLHFRVSLIAYRFPHFHAAAFRPEVYLLKSEAKRS